LLFGWAILLVGALFCCLSKLSTIVEDLVGSYKLSKIVEELVGSYIDVIKYTDGIYIPHVFIQVAYI